MRKIIINTKQFEQLVRFAKVPTRLKDYQVVFQTNKEKKVIVGCTSLFLPSSKNNRIVYSVNTNQIYKKYFLLFCESNFLKNYKLDFIENYKPELHLYVEERELYVVPTHSITLHTLDIPDSNIGEKLNA